MITVRIGTATCANATPLRVVADSTGNLVLKSDREPRIIDQVQQREMEQIAEVEVALEFPTAIGRERATVDMPTV
jgi:hypothetical protein